MRHRAIGLWGGFLMLVTGALMSAALLISGPAAALAPYGPATQPTTVTPTTVAPAAPAAPVLAPSSTAGPSTAKGPSSTAFTGAELALMFTIGAIAIGVGGMIVLVTRRRRSEPAYARDRR